MSDRTMKALVVIVVLAAVGLAIGALLGGSGDQPAKRPGPQQAQSKPPEVAPWVLPDDPNGGERRAPTAGEVRDAMALGIDYLVRVCGENGQFAYIINTNPEVTYKPSYSVLRHEGTLYAMAKCAERAPNDELLDAIGRAARFLREKTIGPVEGHDHMLTVWLDPELTHRTEVRVSKLGGPGLALVSLVAAEKVRPGTTSLDELRKLGRFVVFMQDEDGGFANSYVPSQGGKSSEELVLYYPGEAALGLLMLYQVDPSREWLEAAANAIAYLARERYGQRPVQPDHWALLATALLLPVYDDLDDPPIPREAVVGHAVQICESILAKKPPHSERSIGHGCLTSDGRTCPTATRLEGMLAALTFLPDEYADLRQRITEAGHAGVAFLIRSQIESGEYAGAIPHAICRLPETHASNKKSFNAYVTELRIDYNQHALCAMMTYEDLFLSDQPER